VTARRSPVTVAAAVVVGLVAVLAVFGPWIAPYDPNDGELRGALQSSSGDHWLGTDYLGRDVLSRIIAGSRVAAIAGIEATAVALVLGVGVGMVVGLAGGRVDRVAMRAIDGISAIPAIVLAIAIIAALGTGLTRSMFAVGIAFAMGMARLARGLTLAERERLYVDGARVTGAGRWRLLRHHIAPNIAGPIAVQATLVFAAAVTIEAGLSYLGLGVQPPHASWGTMLSAAQRTIRQSAFQAVPPGLAIVLTVLAINILGDALVRRRRGESYDHPAGYLEPAAIAPGAPRAAAVAPDDGDAPLLDVAGLRVRYGDVVAVDGVDLAIRPGEVVALVGESGSGKTSLAMAVAGLLTPPAVITAERVTLSTSTERLGLVGANSSGRRRWRTNVGVVFQEPSASLNPLQTVGRQLADVIRAQRRTRPGGHGAGVDTEALDLLRDVGLPDPAEVARLRPGQISGGMAQRVMIALALAKQSELLVADEPTTALDVTVQAEIIRLLRSLCERRRLGVLLVTHDLGVAGELSDRCVVLLRGEVVETGPIADVVQRPEHAYTAALVASVPQNVPGRPILQPLARDEAAAVAEIAEVVT
jgi:peptide/nickel transport system permease protein